MRKNKLSLIASWQTRIWNLCNFAWILFVPLRCYIETSELPWHRLEPKVLSQLGSPVVSLWEHAARVTPPCGFHREHPTRVAQSMSYPPRSSVIKCATGHTPNGASRSVVHCMYGILRSQPSLKSYDYYPCRYYSRDVFIFLPPFILGLFLCSLML